MGEVNRGRPFSVLITRPAEDAEELATILTSHGVSCVIEPLLRIRVLAGPAVDLSDVSAVLATSANGIRALAQRVPNRSIRVFAVGEATGRAAMDAGFDPVETACGNVASLTELVARRIDAAQGALLHVAGSAVAGDLAGALSGLGYTYRRCVLYESKTAETLPTRAAAAIEAKMIDGVLFYSPRTARTFCRLVRAAGFAPDCKSLIAFCLSEAVAEEASDLVWSDIVVAARTDQTAMVEAVIGAAHHP